MNAYQPAKPFLLVMTEVIDSPTSVEAGILDTPMKDVN